MNRRNRKGTWGWWGMGFCLACGAGAAVYLHSEEYQTRLAPMMAAVRQWVMPVRLELDEDPSEDLVGVSEATALEQADESALRATSEWDVSLGQSEPAPARTTADTRSPWTETRTDDATQPLIEAAAWVPQPVPDEGRNRLGPLLGTPPSLPRVDPASFEKPMANEGERFVRRRRVEPELTELVISESEVTNPKRLPDRNSQGAKSGGREIEEWEEPAIHRDLEEIDVVLARGEVLAAQKRLSKIYWDSPERREEIRSRLERAAGMVFASPQPHFSEPYMIQPGDQLRKVADRYGLSWQYLSRLNKTDPKRIQVGQKLKVMKGPFSAVVELERFTLTIHLQGYVAKTYVVGVGKENSSPLGTFRVLNKVANPQYTGPDGRVIEGGDPNNPLGGYWLDLGDGYGIHGTNEPDSVGTAASRGCIRLKGDDIEEVYDFLVNQSEVVIRH